MVSKDFQKFVFLMNWYYVYLSFNIFASEFENNTNLYTNKQKHHLLQTLTNCKQKFILTSSIRNSE